MQLKFAIQKMEEKGLTTDNRYLALKSLLAQVMTRQLAITAQKNSETSDPEKPEPVKESPSQNDVSL